MPHFLFQYKPVTDAEFSVHLDNTKLQSSDQMYPWKTTYDYDPKDDSTKDGSGVHPKDEGQNDVKGHDLDDSECGELTLDDVVKIKSATAPKSDAFILVAAGSESTQCAKKQSQKKAGKLSDCESENPFGNAEHTAHAKSHSRRVPVFDDVSIIPSSSEPVFYIGRCTTDGFTTSSDDSTTPEGNARRHELLALVANDNGSGEPRVTSIQHGGYENFRVSSNRSDGCTSSSDEGIQESLVVPMVPSFVPMGRGATVLKLLGLHEPPKPGMRMVMSSPK